MMKKSAVFLLTAVLTCVLFAGGIFTVSADEPESASTALFLNETQNASGVKFEEGDGVYRIVYEFTQPDAVAESAGDITSAQGGKLTLNGKALTEITDATLATEENGSDGFRVVATVPESEIKGDGTDKVSLDSGFAGAGDYVTTVRYMHRYLPNKTWADRIYRSDNMDDYDTVSVTSVGAPGIESGNFTFNIYLSETIAPKKMADMQFRSYEYLASCHTPGGSSGAVYYSSFSEVKLLYNYGIIDEHNENSLLYSMQFGCDSYNGLKMHPANYNGTAAERTERGDMKPQTTINGTDVYTLHQIQDSVADGTCRFFTDAAGNEGSGNGSSTQPLSIQIHMEANHIQFVLKGDSKRDSLIKGDGHIYAYNQSGDVVKTDATSFNENIAPARTENMVVGLKAGMMFPNGKMLKEDYYFVYNPTLKSWSRAGVTAVAPEEDATLSNQEGYTDEEIALMHPEVTDNGGGKKSGCKSEVASDAALPFALAAVVLAGAFVSLRCKARNK